MNQPSLFPEPRRNAGLFSQYYLDEVLLDSLSEFAENVYDLNDEYFRTKFAELEPIIRANEELGSTRSESQLEDEVIRPLLTKVLGQPYIVQETLKGDRPDYVLFPSEENRLAAIKLNKPGSNEYQSLSSGILETKAWKRSPKTEKVRGVDEANISQIFRYLINFNKRWGVLTDGFRWLLFANKPGIRQDQYIEFDLSLIIEKGPLSPDFKLFIFLLRRQAFVRIPGTDSVLDKVLDQSLSNATKLQSNLKLKVYEAFKIVAEEFRRYNHLTLESQEEIAELKESSLIFLYRILFLLYGESRLILPVRPDTKPYYRYSLERIITDIEKDRLQQHGILYWNRLHELFGLIHGLEPDDTRSRLAVDIGLTAYDGGLFDPKEKQNQKLEEWKLGDKAIKSVIDLLAYTGEKTKSNEAKRARVSYRDLGVQHLGNIYEGILENKIILSEDGTVDVVTDNFERHATGSYYTPDYIVDYIVKETLQPIVDEALKNIKTVKKKKPVFEVEEAILRIKVLDPAMGSGHFLIGAIDFLAEQLVKKGNPDTIYTEAELQECRRRIGERCVYGVDLNPMAVELAKLSIWLHTLSQSKPLTFLDNHIKWGNSLIGARLADLHALPDKRGDVLRTSAPTEDAQASMFPESLLNQEVKLWLKDGEIFTNATQTIDDVKAKEKLEAEIERHREKYKHLADLWTACYFIDAQKSDLSILFRKLSDAVVVGANEAQRPESELLDNALAIAKEKRFFHWELEFPEIFFDEQGRIKTEDGGFDAVIGNPPYGAHLNSEERNVLSILYPETAFGNIDSYKFFMQRSWELDKAKSKAGFILSDSFLEKEYFADLRTFIADNSQMMRTIRLGDYVFNEVQLPTSLLFFDKGTNPCQFEYFDIGFLGTNEARAENLEAKIDFITTPPEFRKSLIPRNSITVRHSVTPLIEIYDEVMGVKVYQRGKGKPHQSDDERLEDRFISKESKKGWIPFFSNGIYRYFDTWYNEYIFYGPWLAEPRDLRYFDQPKVVLREIVNPRPFATFLPHTAIVKNTAAVFISKKNQYSLLYLLSLLNSKFLEFKIFELSSKRDNTAFPSFTSRLLKELPIVSIRFTTPKKEREKLTKQLISESELAISSDETEEQIKQKLQPTIALAKLLSAEKNDVLHDFLSHLAVQMLAMNKEKQKLAEDFFMWMENYNIPPRSVLKPKTFLDEFWKKEFKHILAHLTRNKVQIGIQNETKLQDRFNASSEALLSLDKKIALTDWLIDQVVYALYGLTDEEIAVVERG